MGALRAIQLANRFTPRVSRRMVAGDPGILDAIGKGFVGAVGGLLTGGIGGAVAGGVAGVASGLGGSKPSTPSVVNPAPVQPSLPLIGAIGPVSGSGAVGTGLGGQITLPGGISIGGGLSLGGAAGTFGTGLAAAPQPGTAVVGSIPPRGYHLNKHAYFLKNGTHVPALSKYVKNRQRNPLNHRALSRATSRLLGFEHSVKRVNKALNRLTSGHRPRARASSHKSGCGCATCRAA